MVTFTSPAVKIEEIDNSQVVQTSGFSSACFAAPFLRGDVGVHALCTNETELVEAYGKPKVGYNQSDWYQAYNFLQYAPYLYISRACNHEGTHKKITGLVTSQEILADKTETIKVENLSKFTSQLNVGDQISFEEDYEGERYTIFDIVVDTSSLILSRKVGENIPKSSQIYLVEQAITAQNEAGSPDVIVPDVSLTARINEFVIDEFNKKIGSGDLDNATAESVLLEYLTNVLSKDDFELKYDSIKFSPEGRLKFFAHNPGIWGNDISIAIAKLECFTTETKTMAFDGIPLNNLFQNDPTEDQLAIVVSYKGDIVETYIVSLDPESRDHNNKIDFIENVINSRSSYIYVKANLVGSDVNQVNNYVFSTDIENAFTPIKLMLGKDSGVNKGHIEEAYSVFENSEVFDVDIVIGNETNPESAKNIAEGRRDCIAIFGATRDTLVGLRKQQQLANLLQLRKTGEFNYNSMFCALFGDYKYQYDKYTDRNIWVNVAGDMAGLRCMVNNNKGAWWASAGFTRGIMKNVIKMAFSPQETYRDELYKVGINPIVMFSGDGTITLGQKTLLTQPSSFDRINIRSLFNTLEKTLKKMSRYQLMEFNDSFTRNNILAMINPYLTGIKAARGISDSRVICDRSNNTDLVIANNQLIVDIYIKPNYVSEFILLRFTNSGTNSFNITITE